MYKTNNSLEIIIKNYHILVRNYNKTKKEQFLYRYCKVPVVIAANIKEISGSKKRQSLIGLKELEI
jgi:hypothetical protein